MFSYRHAFHAANHADVLKHTVLIAVARYLAEKEVGMTIVDTHAGAGLYQLDDRFAKTSGEAAQGYLQLLSRIDKEAAELAIANEALNENAKDNTKAKVKTAKHKNKIDPLAPLREYIEIVKSFALEGNHAAYPGSPFILSRLLRPQDKLRLFELHPSDSDSLLSNVAALQADRSVLPRQVAAFKENGFAGLKRLLPPPTRRALVLCDPSYEVKEDYALVVEMLSDSLKRFATGTYMIWFPILARREAQDLPRQLQQVCVKAGKEFLIASLQIKEFANAAPRYSREARPTQASATNPNEAKAAGLAASAVFIVNPPFTLKPQLLQTLPHLVELLAVDSHAGFALD